MSKEEVVDRTEIFNLIKQVHFQPSQNLRDFRLPDCVYDLAKKFVEKGREKHCHYYTVLNSIEGGGIYALLERAAGEVTLEQACEVTCCWTEALDGLLHYALNLLLAPNRPELRIVKLYSSFFVYEIANKLEGAEKVLFALGYTPYHQPSAQELMYKEDMNTDHVAETATDLVILLHDLELLRTNMMDCKSSSMQVRFVDILRMWSSDSWSALINAGVPIASYSRGEQKVACDPTNMSRLPPNVVSGVQYRPSNYGQELVGEDYTKSGDQSSYHSSGSGRYKYRPVSVQPSQEAGRQSPTSHSYISSDKTLATSQSCVSSDETLANPWSGNGSTAQRLGAVDDCLRHPAVYSDYTSVPPAKETMQCRKRDESISISTPPSSEADSLTAINLQDIPRPNIDDLPEPVYNDEAEFLSERDSYFGHSFNSDLHFVVDPRSDQDGCDDSMIGMNYMTFSPETAPEKGWDRNTSVIEEAHGTNGKNLISSAAKEVGTASRGDQSVSSHHSSLTKRSQSYDPDRLKDQHSLPLNSTLQGKKQSLASKNFHRSDSDLTGSFEHIYATEHKEDTTKTYSSSHQALQSNSNQPSSLVKDKPNEQRAGNGQQNFSATQVQSKSKHEPIVGHLCESGHVEEDFVVLEICSDEICEAKQTKHKDNRAPEQVETTIGSTTQSSMWTCDYCTNINSKELQECEICGVKKE